MKTTADAIGQAAVGLAKSHGLKGIRVHFCQGHIYIDGDYARDVNAAYAVISKELVRLVDGARKLFALKSRGNKIWYLDSGYTIRRGIKIELTEAEYNAMLMGPSSWDREMAA